MEEKLSIEKISNWLLVLVVTGAIALICNLVGYDSGIVASLPGMGIIIAICLAGLIVTDIIPIKLPAVCWISIIGILIAMPFSPISSNVIELVDRVSLMAVVTPILAYAGVLVGKDWNAFLKIGWRGILVALLVILGTFLSQSFIAEVLLKFL